MAKRGRNSPTTASLLPAPGPSPARVNTLYYGDNIKIMQERMSSRSVDLIYLDPPFKSNQLYNLIYKQYTGRPVGEQGDAFCDTWEMDAEKEEIARAMPVLMRENGVNDYYVNFWHYWMLALKNTQPHLLAYLIYMVQRLLLMKKLLKPTGSIYLHCDPTASHYIKVMMDAIFHHSNFRNEIIWRRTGAHGRAKRWGPIHDTILFYSASDQYTWNRVYEDYNPDYVETFYRNTDEHGRYQMITLDGPGTRTGSSGSPWRGVDPTLKNRHWELPPDRALPPWFVHPPGYSEMNVQERLEVLDAAKLIYWPPKGSVPRFKRYLEVAEGNPVQDIISDIRPIGSQAGERMGYQTQKPIALLKRIIQASSNPGDTVFDPFCGCGTTIYAAHETGRHWIGCDIAILAMKLTREMLKERYHLAEDEHFKVDGIPVSVEQAELLFAHDRFQFQNWAVELVGGLPSSRRTSDNGIDGRLYFDTKGDMLRQMAISVKGGHFQLEHIRELRGILAREKEVEMVGLITLVKPTRGMDAEASKAGMYKTGDNSYPRIQMLTVREILEDKREFKTPTKMKSRIASAQAILPLS